MTHTPLHEQEDVTTRVGNIYQCLAGHLHCSACVDAVRSRSSSALCPTCRSHQVGQVRCIAVEKHRDHKTERVRAKASAAIASVSSNDVNHVNSIVFARYGGMSVRGELGLEVGSQIPGGNSDLLERENQGPFPKIPHEMR